MAYEKPPCSFNQIDKAGKALFNDDLDLFVRGDAAKAIWNWRAAHRYPLNAIHMTLRNRALRTEKTALTAQRLKRPRDPAQLGKLMIDIASGEVEDKAPEPIVDPDKDPAAVSLGRRGGLKGGKARADKLSPEQRSQIAGLHDALKE